MVTMWRKLIGLLAIIAVTALGTGVAVPSTAKAQESCYTISDDYGSGYALTDNGHGAEVTTTNQLDGTCWDFVNGQRWTIPYNGDIVNVYELMDIGSGLCINVGDNFVVYTDSCVAGDWNELFWHSGSLGNEWYINVYGTEVWLYNTPLYANHISNGSSVSVSVYQPGSNENDMWESCDITNGCG
jgi:hypothetical protein